MPLDLERVTDISRQVASSVDDRLNILSVSATEGGGNRVELLVTVEGCHREPCRHLFNVTRADADDVEDELRSKLHTALTGHGVPDPDGARY